MSYLAKSRLNLFSLTMLLSMSVTVAVRAQGIAVTGVGPVNRSMAGAGTAAPLDAIGALHWNPGSISALPSNEVGFGFEALYADVDLSSSVGGISGKTSGEAGFAAIPSIGWVHHKEGTPYTIGLGLYGIGGFRNNMPFDANNPLLNGGLAGPLFADAEILQIAPTVSYAVNDRLSIGVAPTVTAARIQLNPLGPSPVNPSLPPNPGTGNRMHWGGGVQVGVYYITDHNVHLGFTVKSPQWLEDLRFFHPPNAASPTGVTKFDLDYPMIVSLGLAYSGRENWVFAADLRYFDYDNTAGFSEFGFSNILAGAIGAQYRFNDCWHFRFGYNFNQNPLSAADAALNIADPLIQEQNIAVGASYRFAANVDINLAYVMLVDNSLTGPLPAPFNPATDTISHEVGAHSVALGVTVRY